jgi:hypothetical protein
MEHQEAQAYPLMGFQILANPEQPTIAILELLTQDGPVAFALQLQIL